LGRTVAAACALAAAVVVSGCATVPYRYGQSMEQPDTLKLREGEAQIERGEPYWLIDAMGWVLGIPSKIILWNASVDNHRISTETEVALAEYLGTNDLRQVKVRLNQWDPGGEWSRLFRNKSVGWGWRYTIGILSCAFYTILPGRLLGGDNYNPWTDTINIYSDVPAIALHEGGHAKDIGQREWKGTYSFFTGFPLVNLYPEARASGDAIGYLRVEGTADEEEAAYKILYPAYGTYFGGGIGEIATPVAFPLYIGGVVGGHIAGRVKASGVEERRVEEAATEPAATP
jgi:hypothetical protein